MVSCIFDISEIITLLTSFINVLTNAVACYIKSVAIWLWSVFSKSPVVNTPGLLEVAQPHQSASSDQSQNWNRCLMLFSSHMTHIPLASAWSHPKIYCLSEVEVSFPNEVKLSFPSLLHDKTNCHVSSICILQSWTLFVGQQMWPPRTSRGQKVAD